MLIRLSLILMLISPSLLPGQNLPLMIEGSPSSFYLRHTVGIKENYYSIGRMYNVSPSQDLVPFNQLKMEDGLRIGQVLQIPLTETNFCQDAKKGGDESLIPVYYKTVGRRALYQIGQQFNNVPSASLKKWNKLSADQAPEGINLIVGYLKVKTDLSPLSSSKNNPVEKVAGETETQGTVPEPVKKENAAAVKAPPADRKEEYVPVKNNSGGYFRTQYEKQHSARSSEHQAGKAGVFKSTSGWDDGKYYCLNDKAEAGTIIKITNNANQRSVYAKVLDAMPEMKQNEGLILRLSNAAAAELGAGEELFDCTIQF